MKLFHLQQSRGTGRYYQMNKIDTERQSHMYSLSYMELKRKQMH